MIYYCDYEALERKRDNIKPALIPEWLQNEKYDTLLIPLCFTACTAGGKIAHTQDYNKNTKPISFLRFLDQLCRLNAPNFTIYFHNMYYDFNIILYELLHNNFTQYVDTENTSLVYDKLEILEEKVISFDKIFIVLGETLKKSTGVNIYYRNRVFKIRDTFRIITSSQDAILKSFGIPLKPEIDFDNLDINDPEQINALLERNKYDVTSLANCIEKFKSSISEEYGATGNTAASLALSATKHMLGDYFDVFYPKIADREFDTISRMAYNGGITQHTYHHPLGMLHHNLTYIDINSSYPHTMRGNVPYGIPEEIHEFDFNNYSEYLVKIKFKLKKPNIPCIRCSSAQRVRSNYGYESSTYPKKDEFPHEFDGHLALTQFDMLMLEKYYEYDAWLIKGYRYNQKPIFKDFIEGMYDKKYEYKKAGNKVMELCIKIIINSLYGKFAQDLTGFSQFITKTEKLNLYVRDLEKIYCPLSSYIVSAARYNLMEVINANPLNFLYCDTDSAMVFDRDKIPDGYVGNALGQWGYEFDGAYIDTAKILGKKNYMLKVGDEIVVKSVGLPKDRTKLYNREEFEKGNLLVENLDFSNFEIGSDFIIQKMHKVYGGIAMHYTPFTLKERALYLQ